MTRWMETAWAEVGIAETPGPHATSRILDYFSAAGHPEIISDEIAWCAAFAGYCLSSSGVALDAIPRDERLTAKSYLKQGTAIPEPRTGCLAILEHHVGFVAGFTETTIQLLGGNQANAVNVAAFKRSSVLGYRWPEVVQTPAQVEASGSRIAAAARQQQIDGLKTSVAQVAQVLPPKPPGLADFASMAAQAETSMTVFGTLEKFASFTWGKLPLIAVMCTAYWLIRMVHNGWLIRLWRTADANTGKTTSLQTGDVP
jgi:uncharacterized protein (TIGR02594 family)